MAAASGVPLYIYDLSDCPETGHRLAPCPPWWQRTHQLRWKPFSHTLAMRLAPRRLRRDVSRIQARLVEGGMAVWVGGPAAPDGHVPTDNGCAQVAERVRALFS